MNNDGSGADDAAENCESYTLGYYSFLKRLSDQMGPNFILTADGRDDSQRAVSLLNGMQLEGFPIVRRDPYLTSWSVGLNEFSYRKRARLLPFEANYAVLKDSSGTFTEANSPKNLVRLTLGGIVCLGVTATSTMLPNPSSATFVNNLWDEGTRGEDGVSNWLGTPRGPLIRTTTSSTDLLANAGVSLTTGFVNQWTSTDATITNGGAICSSITTATPSPTTNWT